MLEIPTQCGDLFLDITEECLRLSDVFESLYMYEQQLIKFIFNGLTFNAVGIIDVIKSVNCVKKIEGYEKFNRNIFLECQRLAIYFNHTGPVTCHLFDSPKDSKSFEAHTDPDDVVLYVVSGTKHMVVEDEEFVIKAGECLYIPKNTPHQAINYFSSIMLSFGLESFIEDKL